MKLFLRCILIVLFATCFSSCWKQEKPSKITENILNSYLFEFPTKEIEILTIKSDNTFSQVIYLDRACYDKNNGILFSNEGTWIKDEKNLIVFDNWLGYCDLFHPDIILDVPVFYDDLKAFWNISADKKQPKITIYEDTGYIFESIGVN